MLGDAHVTHTQRLVLLRHVITSMNSSSRLYLAQLLERSSQEDAGVFAALCSSRQCYQTKYTTVFQEIEGLAGADTLLGPEMKSTGEVMGIDKDFSSAYAKASIAAGLKLPTSGSVFITMIDKFKEQIVPVGKQLQVSLLSYTHSCLDISRIHIAAGYLQRTALW